jgi:tripartite-type tricarboxylate transporter receptor subunit TctC
MRNRLAIMVCLALGFGAAAQVAAQDTYPSHPINFIVPWGPGGGADQLARVSGKLMDPVLNVSLPVINVPGATGQTGLTKLANSPADGYSIEVLTGDTFAVFADPHTRFKLSQFIPLGIMIQQPSGFYVKIDSPWKNWDDVMAAAQKETLRVAVTGFGSPDDMTVNYFRKKGLKLQSVPFAEPGLRYPSVLGGQSDLLYEQAGDVRSFLDGKKIRPVLFFSDHPFEIYPDIPYSVKLGYDVRLPQFRAIIAAAGTDPARVKRLSDALQKVAGEPEFAAYLKQQLADPNSYVPAKDAIAYMEKWLKEADALRTETNTQE